MIENSPEQATIIDAPLGSIRVAAGAGTGKTHVVAHRVAALVTRHGLEPEEILGITFTNKAAEELSDRIRQVLGGEVTDDREILIHTYHGFAAELLREFGALVGVERDSEVITPTFARQIMTDILANTPIDGIDITSPATLQKALNLAQQMGNNLVDDIPLPDRPDEVDLTRHGLMTAVALYQARKRQLGLIDYSDMIRLAHRLVVEHPAVTSTVAGRFRAVVLDEYQDTDPAQRQLLRLMFGQTHPVLAVGDEDQTIYEWRGASLANFRDFPVHFEYRSQPTPTLALTINLRSAPEILALANQVRTRIDDLPRPPLVHRPGAPTGVVRLARLATAVDEAEWIAADMLRLHQAEDIAWKEMAVLLRMNASMRVIHQALSRAGIPFQVANIGGLLSVPEVADLRAWLQILETPEHGPALARILTGSRYRLGLGDLAAIRRGLHDHPDEEFALLEAIDRLERLDLAEETTIRLGRFRHTYRRLLTTSQGSSLVEVCRQVLDQIGAWSDLEVMSDTAAVSARLNLYRFLDLAEQWSPLEGRPSLPAFLEHLDLMEEDTVEELDVARISVAEAVTLITVHRAKGLEWPVVYLPHLTAGTFPTGPRYDDPFCKPESLPFELRLDSSSLPGLSAEQKDLDRHAALKPGLESQEWRLFYVAVTRAKTHLGLTHAYWYGDQEYNQKPSTPSPMWELAATIGEVVEDVGGPPDRPDSPPTRIDRGPAPDPLFPEGWAQPLQPDAAPAEELAVRHGVHTAFLHHVEEFEQMLFSLPDIAIDPPDTADHSTSVTGLVTYAACPKRFFWSEVERLPRRPSRAARRGVEVHRRIELHNLGAVPLGDAPEPSEWDGSGAPGPFRAFLGSGFADRVPVYVEKPFELAIGGDLAVRGRIDAVYGGDEWEVVDFKSGRRSDESHLVVQLQAYALALTRAGMLPDPSPPLWASFVYLGGGAVETIRYQVDEPWLASAEDRLERLAQGIIEARYDPTPGEHCHGCDFLPLCPAGREFVGT